MTASEKINERSLPVAHLETKLFTHNLEVIFYVLWHLRFYMLDKFFFWLFNIKQMNKMKNPK